MRKAVCVGINLFKDYPSATLHGCVNDANGMTDILKTWLGFTNADITLLTDAQATKANIISNLKTMVDEARAGKHSYLVFSISSHGTQIPDRSGDERDRADECYCPHDLAQAGSQWDPNHIITDDELHDLFRGLPQNVLLEVYADTCHSGDSLRGIDLLLDRKPRYLPPPSLEAFQEVEGRRSRGFYAKLRETTFPHHILWAACRDDQTSADANIGGTWHGAFTYFFCKEMNACRNTLSRAQVLQKVRDDLKKAGYRQIPQLECPATTRALPIQPVPLVASKTA